MSYYEDMGIQNQRGNVFIGSLVFLALAVGFTVLAPEISRMSEVQIRSSRARAVMATQEMKIRAILMEPSTFVNCGPGMRSSCSIDANKLTVVRFAKVPGCAGATDPLGCGVKLANDSFNPSTLTFTGTLSYTGKDTQLHKSDITFTLPPEQLQQKQISCGSGQPLLAGFESDGTVLCRNLPADCPTGKYAVGFDTTNLQPTCVDLPSKICPSGQFMSSYSWVGGANGLSTTCVTPSKSTVEGHFGFTAQMVAAAAPNMPVAIPPASCSLSGTTITSGSSVTAFASSSVPFGQSCQSQTRSCTNGNLTGSFTSLNCVVGSAQSCSFVGQTVPHNSSINAFLTSSVPYGQSCQSETRTCNNGSLSGSYAFSSCSSSGGLACVFNGQPIADGSNVTAYAASSVYYPQLCQSEVRTCSNGNLSGSFLQPSCSSGIHWQTKSCNSNHMIGAPLNFTFMWLIGTGYDYVDANNTTVPFDPLAPGTPVQVYFTTNDLSTFPSGCYFQGEICTVDPLTGLGIPSGVMGPKVQAYGVACGGMPTFIF